jgi:hypothetical protein
MPKAKVTTANTPSSTSRPASPQAKPDGVPNATATVERDVVGPFKTFATQQRKNVEQSRILRGQMEKEIKLNDLKKFADSFKLHTPALSDLVSIIAKDPAKQKEIQEKAERNAEEVKANPTRTTGYNDGQPYRGSSQAPQPIPATQTHAPRNLGARLRNIEQTKVNQMSLNPIPAHEPRLPPTGSANNKRKVVQEEQKPSNSMNITQPNPRTELLSPNPQNILPSESSELINTQNYQAKSLLDSSVKRLLQPKPLVSQARISMSHIQTTRITIRR